MLDVNNHFGGRKANRTTFQITFRTLHDGEPRTLAGRVGWMLLQLSQAGDRGLTTAELGPGLRISEYIRRLRKRHGLLIATDVEKHGGAFAGHHARYRLQTNVEVISWVAA